MTDAEQEALRLAINLARSSSYAVFPCGDDKRPTVKDWPNRASTDPDAIARTWRDHPGPLIGVVTGPRSGVSVLDIDVGHPEACIWWKHHHHRLPRTRAYRTRSGGFHLYLNHRDGVGNSQGKIATGVDTRGEGGYVIFWFAAGLECLEASPPSPWPDWLFDELKRQPPPPRSVYRHQSPYNGEGGIDGILRKLASTGEGNRNGTLFWCACRLADRGMNQGEIASLLLPVALNIGLTETEVRRSIRSAMGRRAA
jgi:hypothetical protein